MHPFYTKLCCNRTILWIIYYICACLSLIVTGIVLIAIPTVNSFGNMQYYVGFGAIVMSLFMYCFLVILYMIAKKRYTQQKVQEAIEEEEPVYISSDDE